MFVAWLAKMTDNKVTETETTHTQNIRPAAVSTFWTWSKVLARSPRLGHTHRHTHTDLVACTRT